MFDRAEINAIVDRKRNDVDGARVVAFVGDFTQGDNLADVLAACGCEAQPGDETRATNVRIVNRDVVAQEIDLIRLSVMYIGAVGSFTTKPVEAAAPQSEVA
jgi:hypothetical protein